MTINPFFQPAPVLQPVCIPLTLPPPQHLNPLPSRGPKRGQNCYVPPVFSGVPRNGGQNHNWRHHPCLCGPPQKGDKISTGGATTTGPNATPSPAICQNLWGGGGGGGVGMTPWCVVLVRSWRRLLADRHSLPFPWTLSLHRRWCPSASHHPLTFLFLCALPFPLPFPFPSLCLSLRRPHCPSALHQSFPFHSLGRLCQRSPWTCPVSLPCVESTQRKANAFAVGQVCPSGHPKPAVRYLSPTAASGPWDGHLRGRFPDRGT